MILESKFIEDTNEQYSILSNGVVISNRTGKPLIPNKNSQINLVIDNVYRTIHTNSLLRICFEGMKCNNEDCSNKVLTKSKYCKSCILKNRESNRLNYELIHHDTYLEKQRQKAKQKGINLDRYYIAKTLVIPLDSLTDELYELHKALILLKRLIKSKKKCQTQQ